MEQYIPSASFLGSLAHLSSIDTPYQSHIKAIDDAPQVLLKIELMANVKDLSLS
jgi:hypothetical protein